MDFSTIYTELSLTYSRLLKNILSCRIDKLAYANYNIVWLAKANLMLQRGIMMKLGKNKGFTLVELIIVIAVIGVLAAMLIPVFSDVIEKANAKSALSDARNSIEQYITEAAVEDGRSPENIVVFVKKGRGYYVFGFDRSKGGSVMSSNGNPFRVENVNDLINTYSWNAKHSDREYDPTEDQAVLDSYTIENDGAFYLVPYVSGQSQNTAVRGHVQGLNGKEFRTLHDEMAENMGAGASVYHGCIVGSSYTATGDAGSGTGQDTTVPDNRPVYTISFAKGDTDGNDDRVTVPAPVQVRQGNIFTPASVTASYAHEETDDEWFVFVSWDEEGAFSVTENRTLTAVWARHINVRYDVVFDGNGGTVRYGGGASQNAQAAQGKDITAWVNGSYAEKADHTFTGWEVEATGIFYPRASASVVNVPEGGITFKAVWAENKYWAKVDLAGGSLSGITTGEKISCNGENEFGRGTQITLPQAPEKDGMVFDCWKTSYAQDDTEYGAGASYVMPAENVTITAHYKDRYSVGFYAYDGTHDTDAVDMHVTAGTQIDVPVTSSPVKPTETMAGGEVQYQFNGWLCSSDGITYTNPSKVTVNSDITMTAQWLARPKYTVSFSAGILAGNPHVQGMPSGFLSDPDVTIVPASYGVPTYDYPGTGDMYICTGWDPAETTVTGTAITFTAQWQTLGSYTVTLTNGDADSISVKSDFTYSWSDGGTEYTWVNGGRLPQGTDISSILSGSLAQKSGNYTFVGWEYDGMCFDGSSSVTVTDNMTFAAKFDEIKYDLIFKSGDGTGADKTEKDIAYNTLFTFVDPSLTYGFTAPENMEFDYWECTTNTSVPHMGAGAQLNITESNTFTAHWKAASREITVTLRDTWNGDSTQAALTITGTSVDVTTEAFAACVNEAMPYFVPNSTNFVVSDDTATVTGTRLAKKSTSGYTAYPANAVGSYLQSDAECYQVIKTETGFGKITGRADGRFMLDASEITLGTVDYDFTFSGALDGRGNAVSYTTAKYGLFSYNTGVIENITAKPLDSISNANTVTGGFIGENKQGGRISSVTVDGAGLTLSSGAAIGGFCGINSGAIENCSVRFSSIKASGTVDVSTSSGNTMSITALGGFCGFNNASGSITGCSYTGNVEPLSASAEDVGGFVGGNRGTVTSCSVNGNVSASKSASCIGGFCGSNYNTGTVTGTESAKTTQTGTVSCTDTGYTYIGGFVGCNKGSISYASAITAGEIAVTVYTGSRVGGFCGSNDSGASISNSEHNSHVLDTGTTDDCRMIGGFCGYSAGTVASCKHTGSVFARQSGTTVNAKSQFVGGFVGEADGGEISSCEVVRCALLQGGSRVGGFAGVTTNSAKVTNSTVTDITTINATETSTGSVGAFVGRMVSSAEIMHCTVAKAGTVNAVINVGGFAGYMNNSTIVDCKINAMTAISTSGTYVGGFAGHTTGSSKISWSYVKATSIDGGNYLGGFIGYGESSTVKYSYARINNLNAAKKSTQYTCGFCGRGDGMTISDCYSMVLTSGYVKSSACGFMYGMISKSTLTNCYSYMCGINKGAVCYRFARTTYATCTNCFYAWLEYSGSSFQTSNSGGSSYSSGGDNRFGTAYWDYSSNYATLKPYTDGYPVA